MADEPPHCPRCGVALPAPEELCPACLLRAALEAEEPGETRLTPPGTPAPAGAVQNEHPTRIGPYRIVRVLGEGGMGVVYLAEQAEPIRRQVALKVIKLGMDTRDVVARFEAERQALALMDHPHIAAVHDAGATADGRPYFAMEYVAGVPVTDYCDARQLPTRTRLALFIAVCDAIQHAHQKGVIHRDIKPSNVLVVEVDGKPVPKVIDFGIAKATAQRLTERTMFTQHGLLIGTPEYMSPEQADPGAVDLDTRTDIYALGVVLYELLVGGLPFSPTRLREAAFSELLRIIREEEPVRPSARLTTLGGAATEIAARRRTKLPTLAQELRGDLDWITLKALEKDRQRRYGSASELAADVGRYLHSEPIVARPPTLGYRVGKFVRRNRLAVGAAGLVAVAVVAGLVVSLVMYRRAEHQRAEADRLRLAADAERVRAEAALETATRNRQIADDMAAVAVAEKRLADERGAEADAQRAVAQQRAYVANLAIAASDVEADVWSATRQLDATRPSLRGWEWYHLRLRADPSLARLEAYGEFGTAISLATSLAFSDDRRTLYWNTEDSVHAWDASSYSVVATYGGFGGDVIAMSSAAAYVLVRPPAGPLRIVEPASGRVVATLQDSGGPVRSGVFSGRRERVATVGADGTIRLWNLPSGRPLATLSRRANPSAFPAFSQESRRLIAASADGGAFLWDIDAGLMLREFPTTPAMSFAETRDGTRVAIGGQDHRVRIWDVASPGPPVVLEGHRGTVLALAFSPEADRLVSTSYDGTVRLWDLEKRAAVAVFTGSGFPALTSVAWDQERDRIIAGAHSGSSGDIQVWDATSRGAVAVLPASEGTVAACFSPDGRLLAGGSEDGRVRLWNAATRQATELIGPGGRPVTAVAFNPGGARLAVAAAGGSIRIVDIVSRRIEQTLDLHTGDVGSVAFSPDGTELVSASDDRTVRVWDSGSGKALARRDVPEQANSAIFTRDGRHVVIGFGDPGRILMVGRRITADLWDWRRNRVDASADARAGSAVGAVAVSPDGKLAFGGTGRAGVTIWDAGLRTRVALVGAATSVMAGQVRHVAYTADGRRVVTLSHDGGVRLWDAESGELWLLLRQAERQPAAMAVSPDSSRIASSDGTAIYLWESRSAVDVDAETVVAELRQRLVLAADVVARLETTRTLRPDVRARALVLARRLINNPDQLDREARGILGKVDAGPEAYRKALRLAQTAAELRPWRQEYVTTVGWATYRLADFQGVVGALPLAGAPPLERSLVVAMARYRLGQVQEARQLLSATRTALAGRRSPGAELTSLVAEAVALIGEPFPEARRLVDALVARLTFADDVLQELRTAGGITEAVRAKAIEFAEARADDPAELYAASRSAVRASGAPAEVYRKALRRAELAVTMAPDQPNYVTTLGWAQYRVGEYAACIATLDLSVSPLTRSTIVAMARYRLGEIEEAKRLLESVRQRLEGRTDVAEELKQLVAEASALIGGRGAP